MRRLSFALGILFSIFFGFSSALAYDPPYPLPYTYNGVTFDNYIEIILPDYQGKIQSYYSGNCSDTNIDYPANPIKLPSSLDVCFCGNNLLTRNYFWGGTWSSWVLTTNQFGSCSLIDNSLDNIHTSKDILISSNYSTCGENNSNNCTVFKSTNVFPVKNLAIERNPELGGGVIINLNSI